MGTQTVRNSASDFRRWLEQLLSDGNDAGQDP